MFLENVVTVENLLKIDAVYAHRLRGFRAGMDSLLGLLFHVEHWHLATWIGVFHVEHEQR